MLLNFDRATFSPEAILAAGYRFTDKFSVRIVPAEDPQSIAVFLEPKSATEMSDDVSGAFSNELIDQQLRLSLAGRTAHIRDLITEFAFGPLESPERKKKL